MAWMMGDSFDFYASGTDPISGGSVWTATNNFSPSGSNTRFGVGKCAPWGTNTSLTGRQITFTASSVYVNFSLNILSASVFVSGGATGQTGIRMCSGGSASSNTQFFFGITNGTLVFGTSNTYTTAQLFTSTNATQSAVNQYVHYQVGVQCSSNAGSVDVRIMGNSTAFYSISGINTANSTAGTAGGINLFQMLGTSGVSAGFAYDDFYVFSGSGATPNTWQGDVRAIQQMPASNSSQISWTPSSGTSSNWQFVDELAEDGDTTYVTSSSTGNFDFYNITSGTSVVVANSIVCVQTKMYSRMDDVGPHQISSLLRSGAAGATQTSSVQDMSASYQWLNQQFVTDPATSTAWTQAGVNAIQLGQIDQL